MTRTQAIEIAHNLTQAVKEGMITREEATRRFAKVVARYKRDQMLKDLQKSSGVTWMYCTTLLEL